MELLVSLMMYLWGLMHILTSWSMDRDAQDAVSAMDGKDLCGQMLRVEMSRNRGRRDDGGYSGGYGSRAPPRKTGFKIRISGLPGGTHWTELKDFVRRAGEVIYANVEGDEGVAEFPDRDTMNRAAKVGRCSNVLYTYT